MKKGSLKSNFKTGIDIDMENTDKSRVKMKQKDLLPHIRACQQNDKLGMLQLPLEAQSCRQFLQN